MSPPPTISSGVTRSAFKLALQPVDIDTNAQQKATTRDVKLVQESFPPIPPSSIVYPVWFSFFISEYLSIECHSYCLSTGYIYDDRMTMLATAACAQSIRWPSCDTAGQHSSRPSTPRFIGTGFSLSHSFPLLHHIDNDNSLNYILQRQGEAFLYKKLIFTIVERTGILRSLSLSVSWRQMIFSCLRRRCLCRQWGNKSDRCSSRMSTTKQNKIGQEKWKPSIKMNEWSENSLPLMSSPSLEKKNGNKEEKTTLSTFFYWRLSSVVGQFVCVSVGATTVVCSAHTRHTQPITHT